MVPKLQTIGDTVRLLPDELSDGYPRPEARAVIILLLEWITGLTGIDIHKQSNRPLSDDENELLTTAVRQLKKNIPVQHITGYSWFMERQFKVNSSVLIPRQETEELVVLTIKTAGKEFNGNIIDFCTGSGAIAISLKLELPEATVTATDISAEALSVAETNCLAFNATITLLQHDLLRGDFNSLPQADIITANPPYVRESEKSAMEKRVTEHEPAGALFVPDNNPLIFYKALLKGIELLLKADGWFLLEINEALGQETLSLFSQPFVRNCEIIDDIHGKNRFICGQKA
jgi:release factor glutamine methyltransferase